MDARILSDTMEAIYGMFSIVKGKTKSNQEVLHSRGGLACDFRSDWLIGVK